MCFWHLKDCHYFLGQFPPELKAVHLNRSRDIRQHQKIFTPTNITKKMERMEMAMRYPLHPAPSSESVFLFSEKNPAFLYNFLTFKLSSFTIHINA